MRLCGRLPRALSVPKLEEVVSGTVSVADLQRIRVLEGAVKVALRG